jgi:cyclophilin family peptidyl-prolyl cis-trans isomerase
VTSSNPDIKATVAQGKFLTINVTHTAASGVTGDISFTGSVMFQLFEDLTPITAGKVEGFTTSGFYNGKTIHRVAGNFTNQNLPFDFVIQGGAPNPDGTGSSGLPGTPFGIEPVQQLAYVQPGSLAMARSTSPNSNDTQFFFTTGTPTSLDYQYTIFGQVVAGASTIAKITQVATTTNSGLGGEKSLPISPITITSATLSSTNPNGVIHIDATGAVAGETSSIRVTATDTADHTTALQTFNVTVGPDTTTHPASFTFKPLAFPVTQSAQTGTATTVQLNGTTQNPNNSAVKVTYALASQPSHGTITNFNATTGALTYTPAASFTGTDTFKYTVTNTGGTPSPLVGNTQTVTLNVTPNVTPPVTPVNTGTVRVIGTVLVVTPRPRTDGGTNTIIINQANAPGSPANDKLVVSINGQYDVLQPLVSSIDRVVVYGSKANDNITVLPTVDPTLRVTLDGGHGGKNFLQAGAGPTRLHGWFGKTTLTGGTGANQLVGRKGHVFFRPTSATNQIFASGTFFRFVNGKIVPIA